MAESFQVTVWYMPRALVLRGELPPLQTSVFAPPATVWSFVAEGAPPPRRRSAVWRVKYQPPDGREQRTVRLDMRFVRHVEPLG